MTAGRVVTRIFLVGAVAALAPQCSASSTGPVAATPALLARLKHAQPNEVIALEPGDYSGVNIDGFRGSATITSAEPGRRAILHDFRISGSSGLTLKNLDLSTANTPPGAAGAGAIIPFVVSDSSNIVLDTLEVHGSATGSLATDTSGMIIRSSDQVSVTNSEFHHLHDALAHLGDTNLNIVGNHFHHLRDDAIRGGGSSFVLIENNRCDSNHPDAGDMEHPDCIQFWTANTTTAAHDITIRGNRYDRGSGTPVQGIFLSDEVGNIPFERVTISGNVIQGASYNAISIIGAVNPVIQDNWVCAYPDQESWISVRQSRGAHVTGNSAPKEINYVNTTDAVDGHNRVANVCSPFRG